MVHTAEILHFGDRIEPPRKALPTNLSDENFEIAILFRIAFWLNKYTVGKKITPPPLSL